MNKAPIFFTGLDLSQKYYQEIVQPILDKQLLRIPYAVALIGDGSEVLGYDTPVSSDHDWGPRMQIFLSEEYYLDNGLKLLNTLNNTLPSSFLGWPTYFGDRDRPSTGNIYKGLGSSHGVEIHTLEYWIANHFSLPLNHRPTEREWLAIPEQLLLSFISGKVFFDNAGDLTKLRKQYVWMPRNVWLCKMIALWKKIEQELPFVGRCGDIGDDIGSHIIAARLIQDIMRLCFLIERKYCPYSKWFGTGFNNLLCATQLQENIQTVLHSKNWEQRQEELAKCCLKIANLYQKYSLFFDVKISIRNYHDRPYLVINTSDIIDNLKTKISNNELLLLSSFGGIEQISDSVDILCNNSICQNVIHSL